MKELIELQPLEWQYMYYLIKSSKEINLSRRAILSIIQKTLLENYSFPKDSVEPVASLIYERLTKSDFYNNFLDVKSTNASHFEDSTENQMFLYPSDLDQIRIFYQKNPDPQIIKLLIAFTVYYRKNFHKSHWVNYNRKVIFYLAGIDKLSTQAQNQLTTYLHSHYNLNMQVVGSKQPIPCFTLDWCEDIPEVELDNKIYLGLLHPDTITLLCEQFKNEFGSV